ncbi:MAG: hypothetical protein V8Q79_10525, partial [Christensenellales bacterium]
MNKKAIIIVLDSVGIGELPDAAAYGDKGADTLGDIINTCHPELPNMMGLGLANIDGASFPGKVDAPKGCYGKLRAFPLARIRRPDTGKLRAFSWSMRSRRPRTASRRTSSRNTKRQSDAAPSATRRLPARRFWTSWARNISRP